GKSSEHHGGPSSAPRTGRGGGTTGTRLAPGRAAGPLLGDLLGLALDRAGALAWIHGLSDPRGNRGPDVTPLRRLVVAGEQGAMGRALRGARRGGCLRHRDRPPGPPVARTLFAVAWTAAGADGLDAHPLPCPEVATAAAQHRSDWCAGPELWCFP